MFEIVLGVVVGRHGRRDDDGDGGGGDHDGGSGTGAPRIRCCLRDRFRMGRTTGPASPARGRSGA